MSKADMDVQFYSGEDAFETKLFRPGESVRGTVTVYPQESFACAHLYLRLIWHTEGRGTQHKETVQEADLFQGEFMASMPQTYDFQFDIPNGPWSYDGHYISIIWKVEAQLDVSWARDPKISQPFLLQPAGRQ